jgi:hypothetical protein
MQIATGYSEPDGYFLAYTLDYEAQQGVKVYRSDLPDGAGESLGLVAVEVNRGYKVLDQICPSFHSIGTVDLWRGSRICGRISLVERFPDIDYSIQKHDVLVFWTYQMKPIQRITFPRLAGWVQIPMRVKGSPIKGSDQDKKFPDMNLRGATTSQAGGKTKDK